MKVALHGLVNDEDEGSDGPEDYSGYRSGEDACESYQSCKDGD